MRRPPDRNGQPVLSERDVDSSNATLNTLFGGSRQKSWMTGPGTPVRPSPRRSASTSKAPGPAVTFAQKTMAALLPSPAPSDEPSAILTHSPANTLRIENRRGLPNEESNGFRNTYGNASRDPQYSTSEAEPQPTSRQPNKLNASLQPYLQAQSRVQTTTLPIYQEPQPSGITNIPPLPSSVLLPSNRQNCTSDSLRPANSLEDHTQYPPRLELPSGGSSSSAIVGPSAAGGPQFSDQQPRPQAAQSTSQRVNSHGHLSSPVGNPNLPLPSAMLQNQGHPSASIPVAATNQHNPHKRQRIQAPIAQCLRSRAALIDSHIQSVGGSMNLNTGLERPRFQLLREACNEEDDFYVALHQIFCVWDFDRGQLTRIHGFPSLPILLVAFRLLGQLIRDNDQLAPNHKKWFAQFPYPLPDLLRTSEPYRRTINNVGVFLGKLAADWGQFSRECSNRGYPPLVDELVNRMWVLSPILQGVLFTATRRNLGVMEESIGAKMEEMFRTDRQDHQALSARMHTDRPPTEREMYERNGLLAREYSNLLNQALRLRQSSASGVSAGSPMARFPTPLADVGNRYHQGAPSPGIPSHAQLDHAQFHANLPNGAIDMSGNRQYANGQQSSMNSGGSPNPGVAALSGRPSSVNGHRLSYANANSPSPILMQNLSMQSPIQPNLQSPPVLRSNIGQMEQNQNPQGVRTPGSTGTAYQNQQQVERTPQQLRQMLQHQQQMHVMAAQQQHQHRLTQQSMQWQGHVGAQGLLEVQQQATQVQMQGAQNMNLSSEIRSDRNHPQNRVPSTNNLPNNGRQTPPGIHVSPYPQTSSLSNRRIPSGAHVSSYPQAAGSSNGRIALDVRVMPYAQINGPQMSPALMHQVKVYGMTPPLERGVVPPLGFVHHPQQIHPELTALHQAHLRSPRLIPAQTFPPNISADDPARRFYQVTKGFAHGPSKISGTQAVSTFEFFFSDANFALIAPGYYPGKGQIEDRKFRVGTLQYRLRSIKRLQNEMTCSSADWVVSDTVWPENGSLDMQLGSQRHQLEIRRKAHHGKDLPIDVTTYLRLAGANTRGKVTMSNPGRRLKLKESSYFFAIEVIEILGHKQILDNCVKHKRKPASETLNAIKKSLAGPDLEDDDDIAMVTSDLSIELADPFTARIFEIPVRGNNCLHRECFDLETFLLTRNSKPQRTNQPCMVDVWKCPLCGKDARPYSLHIDDFMVGVRDELKRKDMLDIKAIWIDQDGKWRPKEEKKTGSGKRKASENASDSEDDFPKEDDKKSDKIKAAAVFIDLEDD